MHVLTASQMKHTDVCQTYYMDVLPGGIAAPEFSSISRTEKLWHHPCLVLLTVCHQQCQGALWLSSPGSGDRQGRSGLASDFCLPSQLCPAGMQAFARGS